MNAELMAAGVSTAAPANGTASAPVIGYWELLAVQPQAAIPAALSSVFDSSRDPASRIFGGILWLGIAALSYRLWTSKLDELVKTIRG